MNQIRLDDIFEGSLVFAHGGRQRLESNWTAAEFLDQRRQERSIESIEAGFVYVESTQGKSSRIERHQPGVSVANRGKISDPA